MTPLLAFGPECCMLPPLLLAGLVYYLLSKDERPTGDADRPDNWPPHWPKPPVRSAVAVGRAARLPWVYPIPNPRTADRPTMTNPFPAPTRTRPIGRPTVLVVNDTDETRAVMVRLLDRRGLAVATAADADAGVAAALADRPDLVLLDLNMPGEDGWAAAGRLRAAPGGDDLWVIALSVRFTPGERDRAIAAGCDDFLSKPLDLTPLADHVAALLQAG